MDLELSLFIAAQNKKMMKAEDRKRSIKQLHN
jgi:hypothetical protein